MNGEKVEKGKEAKSELEQLRVRVLELSLEVMKVKRNSAIIFVSSVSIVLIALMVVYGSTQYNWHYVTGFSGDSEDWGDNPIDVNTDYFNIPGHNWRIKWTAQTANETPSDDAYFDFAVYSREGGFLSYFEVESVNFKDAGKKQGFEYIIGSGDFHFLISGDHVFGWTIQVEAYH